MTTPAQHPADEQPRASRPGDGDTTPADTWQPANPGDTPGQLTPEHGPTQPVDLTARAERERDMLDESLRATTRSLTETTAERDEARQQRDTYAERLDGEAWDRLTRRAEQAEAELARVRQQRDRLLSSPDTTAAPSSVPPTRAQEPEAPDVEGLLANVRYSLAAARDDSERAEAIEMLLSGWYAAWPESAVTDPDWPLAGELVRLLAAPTGPDQTAEMARLRAEVDSWRETAETNASMASAALAQVETLTTVNRLLRDGAAPTGPVADTTPAAETHTEYTWRQNRYIATDSATTNRAKAERSVATVRRKNPGASVTLMTRSVTGWVPLSAEPTPAPARYGDDRGFNNPPTYPAPTGDGPLVGTRWDCPLHPVPIDGCPHPDPTTPTPAGDRPDVSFAAGLIERHGEPMRTALDEARKRYTVAGPSHMGPGGASNPHPEHYGQTCDEYDAGRPTPAPAPAPAADTTTEA